MTGPIAGALVNKFGCRVVAMVGSLIASIGFFLCVFSPNLNVMILLYGAVAGCGFGLMYLPAILMVGYYFEKRRAFATGIAVCGSGIGNFIFAPLSEFLLKHYSWQGAMWITSGMVLNGIVFATLYRPISRQLKNTESKINVNESKDNDKTMQFKLPDTTDFHSLDHIEFDVEAPLYKAKSMNLLESTLPETNNEVLNVGNTWTGRLAFSHLDISKVHKLRRRKSRNAHATETFCPLDRKDIFYSGSLRNILEHRECKTEKEYIQKMTIHHNPADKDKTKGGYWNKAKSLFFEMFDFSLLLSPTFFIYGLSCFLCMFGFFIPFNFLPDLAKDLNISSNDAAFLISMIGISNTLSRILVGFVSDQPWADCLLINNISLIIGGMATFFVPFYKEYYILATYGIVFGSAIGTLSDQTGDYDISFYLSGSTMALAGIICLPLRKIANWENTRLQAKQKDTEQNMPERDPML
ncbi:hypothetical protein KUTeg_014510 [Tegillarca granosa]|uniref:Major facilitator superfamily (MFS) profile domain-containing protein n=1 Tax=Tegillarca granosa TaxID=220873 RepID=A0ABQ9ERT9_TEGGR|nr:hypothetical protein KUTeg_014510 [Tegillarca granosa]